MHSPISFENLSCFFSVNHMQVAGGAVILQKHLASRQVLGELRSGLAAPPHTQEFATTQCSAPPLPSSSCLLSAWAIEKTNIPLS